MARELQEHMKKVHWQYYFARKFSLQRFQVVLNTLTSDFYLEHFKVRLKNILIKPEEGGNHAIWLDAQEYEAAIKKIFKVVCRDLKTFYYYKRMIKATQKRWLKAATFAGSHARAQSSQQELAKLYDLFIFHHQEHFNKPIWIPFPIEPLLSDAASAALVRVLTRAKKTKEYDRWFGVVFAPEEQNAISACGQALLMVAVECKKDGLTGDALIKVLDRIREEYGFIPCYDVIDAPWERDHFQEELDELLKKSFSVLEQELQSIAAQFTVRHKAFEQFVRDFNMSVRERELLVMAHELVFIKDERDDYRRRGSFATRPLFAEMGRRMGLGPREAAYLTIEEAKAWLHHNVTPPSAAELHERMQGYVLLRKQGKPMVVASGEMANDILHQELGDVAKSNVKEVKGVVGSPGNVQGLVVVVRTKHDLRRVGDGMVMVAVTTNPDFVPAMKKCVAIVTDEGGITAHASIVSRELRIPCIVGTKVGTTIFKDGDRVEVDAERGIVRKV